MDFRAAGDAIKKYQWILILVAIVALMGLFLQIRLIPSETLLRGDGINLLGNDPWYHLRQVEVTVQNFPHYSWVDPMTRYPIGSNVHWGSLFTEIIASFALLAGAHTRPELIRLACYAPPLIGVLLVPIVYYIGKLMQGWKTGLIAALFVAVISGQFFYRSLFGFVDHHVAEVLFGTLFCLAYMGVLVYTRNRPVALKDPATLEKPAFLTLGAVVAYLLGLFTMPTMILFALIVAVYTAVQMTWDYYCKRDTGYLVLINTVLFSLVTLGMLVHGLHHEGLGFARYTIGHAAMYPLLIGGTAVLHLFTTKLTEQNRPWYWYPACVAGFIGGFFLLLYVASPVMYDVMVSNFCSFFGTPATSITIQEARPWSFAAAYASYNFGLFLMGGGYLALVYQFIKKYRPELVFVFVWSLVMMVAVMGHVRYEYYFAVNIAVLAACCVGFVLERCGSSVRDVVYTVLYGLNRKKGAKSGFRPRGKPNIGATVLFIVIMVVGGQFAFDSYNDNVGLANSMKYSGIQADWKESLLWMEANTPEPDIEYYGCYDYVMQEDDRFEYATDTYGVMSWWDYGHWITYLAKRIPNANPFQQGVMGANGSATFFITQDEATANQVLDNLGTNYIVTDIEMDTQKFWAMATWYQQKYETLNYIVPLMREIRPLEVVRGDYFNKNYFMTMIVRLHSFDGSMIVPDQTHFVEYDTSSSFSIPKIKTIELMDTFAAKQRLDAYQPSGTLQAELLSPSLFAPCDIIPALHNYRLIHESPTNVLDSKEFDLKYVKVFEYVEGAHIKGEGYIYAKIETNTGRTFYYLQQSENGEFIVPYSTDGNPYGVKVVDGYYLESQAAEGQNAPIKVTEMQVVNGETVN